MSSANAAGGCGSTWARPVLPLWVCGLGWVTTPSCLDLSLETRGWTVPTSWGCRENFTKSTNCLHECRKLGCVALARTLLRAFVWPAPAHSPQGPSSGMATAFWFLGGRCNISYPSQVERVSVGNFYHVSRFINTIKIIHPKYQISLSADQ